LFLSPIVDLDFGQYQTFYVYQMFWAGTSQKVIRQLTCCYSLQLRMMSNGTITPPPHYTCAFLIVNGGRWVSSMSAGFISLHWHKNFFNSAKFCQLPPHPKRLLIATDRVGPHSSSPSPSPPSLLAFFLSVYWNPTTKSRTLFLHHHEAPHHQTKELKSHSQN
jgi:hypothetical protein